MVEISFAGGTLRLLGLDPVLAEGVPFDDREACHRAPAQQYASLLRRLHRAGVPVRDEARKYEELNLRLIEARAARSYQTEALEAWAAGRSSGVIVLPTGAGKSFVGVHAIYLRQRSALVVAPTLDLVRQWHGTLTAAFGEEVGVVGGGEHTWRPLTVTTYDSAFLHMDRLGNRFGLVIFDECHHLPGESYAQIARMMIAPFRLGLTATPERADGRESVLEELIGPIVYRKDITEMAGEYLAPYDTVRQAFELTEEEREEYEAARELYLAFVRSQGISLGSPQGFTDFIRRASRTEAGRQALIAYRRQRALAFGARSKLDRLAEILHQHRMDRTIIFTEDNRTAYEVSRRFLVPVITHQTKVRERTDVLTGFHEGRYHAVVTSKVLNEGVDVPSANVAVVLSGSGSVMEHVQRLGRILRQQADKRAVLYELVSARTSESRTSDRRRDHAAYQNRGRGGSRAPA